MKHKRFLENENSPLKHLISIKFIASDMPSNNNESSSHEQPTTSDVERQERIRTSQKKIKDSPVGFVLGSFKAQSFRLSTISWFEGEEKGRRRGFQ